MADKEFIATGRRKTSIAVVKLVKGKGRIFVNGRKLLDHIGNKPAIEMMVYRPLVLTENQEKYDVRVKAVGGGVVSQAGAIRHGIARALVKANEEYKTVYSNFDFAPIILLVALYFVSRIIISIRLFIAG